MLMFPGCPPGLAAARGIAGCSIVLTVVFAFGLQLGLSTFLVDLATTAVVLLPQAGDAFGPAPGHLLGCAAARCGRILASTLHDLTQHSATEAAWATGVVLAFACNLTNNLPAGLIAGATVHAAQVPQPVTGAVLIGVDVGPNLSVTGSLATIL
jgi:arsenical pump membrane protein